MTFFTTLSCLALFPIDSRLANMVLQLITALCPAAVSLLFGCICTRLLGVYC